MAGVYHDHEVARRHDVQALAAQADAGRPDELAAASTETGEATSASSAMNSLIIQT